MTTHYRTSSTDAASQLAFADYRRKKRYRLGSGVPLPSGGSGHRQIRAKHFGEKGALGTETLVR